MMVSKSTRCSTRPFFHKKVDGHMRLSIICEECESFLCPKNVTDSEKKRIFARSNKWIDNQLSNF